jgi:hypothetical protein
MGQMAERSAVQDTGADPQILPTRPLFKDALSASRCLITVIGDHAGEVTAAIFQRKRADIQKVNHTFWLIKSPKAKPGLVRSLCVGIPYPVLFVAPATGGARPTQANKQAIEYSEDRITWRTFPVGLGPVTGKRDSGAYALVFDELATVEEGTVDLWSYADFADPGKPVRMTLGCSALFPPSHDSEWGIRSRFQSSPLPDKNLD